MPHLLSISRPGSLSPYGPQVQKKESLFFVKYSLLIIIEEKIMIKEKKSATTLINVKIIKILHFFHFNAWLS